MKILKYKNIEYCIKKSDFLGIYCAYVKLPKDHRFIKNLSKKINFKGRNNNLFHYNYKALKIRCHGKLTFGTEIKDNFNGFTNGWWIGWDYGQKEDHIPKLGKKNKENTKKYKLSDIKKDCKNVIDQIIDIL